MKITSTAALELTINQISLRFLSYEISSQVSDYGLATND